MCPFYGAKLLTQSLTHLRILKEPQILPPSVPKAKSTAKKNYPYKQELSDDSKHFNIEWMDLFIMPRFYKCV